MQPKNVTLQLPMTFEQMYADCLTYCRRIARWKINGASPETVDDLVADSFERLYRLWPTLADKPAGQQKRYLAQIVANRCIDYLRRMRLEHAIFVTEAQLEAAVTDTGYDSDIDALSIYAYLTAGRVEGTDSPERVYLAREELREVLDACAFEHNDNMRATEQVRTAVLANALGYESAQIARAQKRSESAVKMTLMRARERMGVPKQVQQKPVRAEVAA